MTSDNNQWYANEHQWYRVKINDRQNQGYPMELNDIPTKIKDVGRKSTTSNKSQWPPLKIDDMPTSINDAGWQSMISNGKQWHAIQFDDMPTSINDIGLKVNDRSQSQWCPIKFSDIIMNQLRLAKCCLSLAGCVLQLAFAACIMNQICRSRKATHTQKSVGAAKLPIHRLIMCKSRTATHTQINLFRTKSAGAESYTFTEI